MSEGYKLSKVKEDINKFFDDLSTLTYPQKAIFNIGASTRPNLLDNWYFVGGGSQQGWGQFPINQRGQTSYNTDGYSIDRWINIGGTISLTGDGIGLPGGSINQELYQLLESTDVKGKTCTISALLSTGLVQGTFVFPSEIADNVVAFDDHENFALIARVMDTGLPACSLWTYGGKANTVLATKLELGPTQTLAHQDEDGNWQLFETPDFQEELAKCQAYLWVPQQRNGFTILGVGHAESANVAWVTVVPPVSMRTGGAPTVKISDVSALNLRGSSIVTATSVFIDQAMNGTPILFTVGGTFTPGEALDVFLSNSARIEFSREL